MSNKKHRRIVIYGGSFNPPHIGHMIAIEAVLRNFPCDEIWVMPSSKRLDKKIGVSGKHRINMLKIALRELFPSFVKISNLELKRPSLTTTYDTLNELKNLYPHDQFYFLIGSELLWDIRYKWVRGRELWETCNFLAIRKPGIKVPAKLPPNIKLVDKNIIWVNISSTIIRSFIQKEYSGIPHIDQKVASYIKKNKLYK